MVVAVIRAEAEKAQEVVRQEANNPYERIGDLEQRVIDQRGWQRQLRWVTGRDGLRRHLSEDQHDDGQNHRAGEDSGFTADANSNHSHDCGCGKIHGVVAEQNQADDPVGSLQQLLGEARRVMACARTMPQPIPVEAHQCGFRAGEERGQEEQNDE